MRVLTFLFQMDDFSEEMCRIGFMACYANKKIRKIFRHYYGIALSFRFMSLCTLPHCVTCITIFGNAGSHVISTRHNLKLSPFTCVGIV